MVSRMNRHAPRSSSLPQLTALDTGLCLLGAEILRQLDLPCPSDAEILACSALGPPRPEQVELESRHLRQITAHLVESLPGAGEHRPRPRRR
jgi:hypothetical protein